MTEQELELLLAEALANPDEALEAMLALEAEKSLIAFVKMTWHILEPKREFVDGWVVREIARHLEAITNGDIRHLLINVPPGFMKSMLTQVFWPAWEWGPANRPDIRYVGASYSEALTVRDNRRARQLIQSDLYQRHWGSRFHLVADQNAKVRYDTSEMGFKIATSVGGMGTGERGDRFIIDDPHNVKEGESEAKRNEASQWFTEVVPTRINDPEKSAIIVIMQRVHELDVSGLIIRNKLNYDHLCVPMEYEEEHPTPSKTKIGFDDPRTEEGELAWPERFSARHLEEDLKPALRAWGGSYAEAGQLQQRPAPRGGGMFKRDDFIIVDRSPAGPGAPRVRGWDLAATDSNRAAYTVGLKMARAPNDMIVIEDVDRFRLGPGQVEQRVLTDAKNDGLQCAQSLPQDPGQAGKSQRRAFAALLEGFNVHFSLESGDKEFRAIPLAAQVEAGNVILVRAEWTDAFLAEVCMFPAGEFKDQVDGASRAYAWLLEKVGFRLAIVPPEIVSTA